MNWSSVTREHSRLQISSLQSYQVSLFSINSVHLVSRHRSAGSAFAMADPSEYYHKTDAQNVLQNEQGPRLKITILAESESKHLAKE